MKNAKSAHVWLWLSGLTAAALVIVPSIAGAADPAGFDGFIQSGTCASPTDDLVVKMSSDGPHDVTPYVAKDVNGAPTTIGYYGAPEVAGFGLAAIYAGQKFSMVIADTDTGDPVACGDILQPDADRYSETGFAVVQLLPVGSGSIHGAATLERTRMQREDDVTPTKARIVLSTDAPGTPAPSVDGYDGYVQNGQCPAPSGKVRVQLKSQGSHDVKPFTAHADGSDESVTVAYFGAPGAPGFGIGTTYTDEDFAVVISDTNTGETVACGDILEPDDDKFTEAGLALVRLSSVSDAGVEGFAVVDRAHFSGSRTSHPHGSGS